MVAAQDGFSWWFVWLRIECGACPALICLVELYSRYKMHVASSGKGGGMRIECMYCVMCCIIEEKQNVRKELRGKYLF